MQSDADYNSTTRPSFTAKDVQPATCGRSRRPRPAFLDRTQAGISLVEASVACAISCVVLAATLLSFTDMLHAKQLEGLSAELTGDLHLARTAAVLRNESVRLTIGQLADGKSCYAVHTGPSLVCDCGRAPEAICAEGGDLIKASQIDHEHIRLRSESASVMWHPIRGTITPTATYRLTMPDGRGVNHVVNLMGRVRVCSSGVAVSTYPAC